MFHNRTLNNHINRIHERALRIIYQDQQSSFEGLLEKDNSFTIHRRNLQALYIELYKVAYTIAHEEVSISNQTWYQISMGIYFPDS